MSAAGRACALLLGVWLSSASVVRAEGADGKGTGSMEKIADCCAVLELRQYTLKPGQRDVLIDLFDDKFIAGQEDVGMTIVGQFRDLDAADRFVWLRGFAGMPQRKRALESFYGGSVWQGNRAAANGTMVDSDNVLLLRPASASSGFALQGLTRDQRPAGMVVFYLHYLRQPADASMLQDFERRLRSSLRASGSQLLAVLASEHSKNTFAALPVRLGEEVVAWVAGFADQAAYDAQRAVLEDIAKALEPIESGPAERLRLLPTSQSLLRGVRETQP